MLLIQSFADQFFYVHSLKYNLTDDGIEISKRLH